MGHLLTAIRILTAIAAPLAAIILLILTHLKLRGVKGESPEEGETCLCCGKAEPGDIAQFHYSESVGSPRDRAAQKQLTLTATPILGSETHFICDSCAKKYVRNETIQIVLLSLPYPLYLYVIIPLFVKDGVFANFLIETLLVVVSVARLHLPAYDLFRPPGTARPHWPKPVTGWRLASEGPSWERSSAITLVLGLPTCRISQPYLSPENLLRHLMRTVLVRIFSDFAYQNNNSWIESMYNQNLFLD